jgi:hypothetical protein
VRRPTKLGCDPSGIDRSLESVSGGALRDHRLIDVNLAGCGYRWARPGRFRGRSLHAKNASQRCPKGGRRGKKGGRALAFSWWAKSWR